ncbi:p21-activated protein kinase-interacting protein 1-like [Tetranychus urticae]|uniref:Uncharacterized protein n=1 Tax=Tetranychus urticae TaxID=32264 RepID=T1K745_TETUR|nr:p21-activated protein kinase-interacting protein 1-like [Tetranychus urticae]
MVKANFEAIVGTYQKYLVGISVSKDKSAEYYNFVQSFAEEAHIGTVKCVAAFGNYVVSGGTDEFIRVFDMSSRRDVSSLLQQEGTINCLKFINDSYLISGSEDSTLCVWTTSNWNVIKTLKGHKGGVNGVSVHPKGSLALSVGKDQKIITWDLVKARNAFVTNLKEIGKNIIWSPSEKHFIVLFDRRIDFYDVNVAAPVQKVTFTKDVNCANFLNDSILLVGLENGCIEMVDISHDKPIKNAKIHNSRIKDICVTNKGILSAASDGAIKLIRKNNFGDRGSTNLGCRITCMTISNHQS